MSTADDKKPVATEAARTLVADAMQRVEEAEATARLLDEQLQGARVLLAARQAEADEIVARELAAEIEWERARAQANHDRHELHCKAVNADLDVRRAKHPKRADGSPDLDPEILVFTVDGNVHQVRSREPLKHGHKGYGNKAREASRYHATCHMSVDTPHDELHAERFAQGAKVTCPDCIAIAAGENLVDPDDPSTHRGPLFNPPVPRAPLEDDTVDVAEIGAAP